MKNLLRSLRDLFLKPAVRIGLGVLVTGGFIAGVLAWQGFNTAMEATNKEEFCLSCHTMHDNLLPELQKTCTGTTAPACARAARLPRAARLHRQDGAQDAGEPRGAGPAAGTIDTREKFKEHRIVLAQREWKRFSANGSKECRACHDYKDMDFDKMRPASQVAMRKAAERNQSCVDCHKGVAHQLPEMKGARNPAFDTLVSSAAGQSVDAGKDYFLVVPQELFADEGMTKRIGAIEVATQVKVLETKGDAQRVELALWRKNKGYGRVWYSHFGLNITSAILDKEIAQDMSFVKVLDTREDPMTGLEWQQVTATAWMRKGSVLDSVEPVWSIARASYSSSCSVCHRQPEEAHFDANTWPGLFGGMVGFTSMDDDTARVVLKYLQTHSSDFSTSHGAGSPDSALQTARP
jgi:Nitrate/TMAO reductases, membrane-bound tetraheme cytochrome c subunit